jgi:hypothetical protein
MTMYKFSKKKRKEKGLKGREFMINNLSNKIMCNKMIDGVDTTIEKFTPRKRFDTYKVI